MPEPVTTILTGAAGKAFAGSIAKELVEVAKKKAGFELKKWKASNHADTIYKRIRQLRLVKTILQSEKEVDLTTFYVPPRVLIAEKRTVISQLSDISQETSVLIEGTVGQGKSIFLRYLASVEFCKTRRVPIFIELRRFRNGTTLEQMALAELKSLGFEMTREVFHFFAGEGRLLLMLDAFDEVKIELREELIGQIESLLRQHDLLRAVITSRPDSGISNSPSLRVFKLCPLAGREYEQVISKMSHSPEVSNAIISGIRSEASTVGTLLTTPLMVALLVIRYKVDQSLPQNSTAFYDSLFALLLQRHDKTKGGYIRPRKSSVTDSVLEEFFNALCFVSRKADENSFTRSRLNEFAREALRIVGLPKSNLDNTLGDIIDITCMIITDGDECRFIHKSLQEYHAALFIQRQPDDSALDFYRAMPTHWQAWKQELTFLSIIDRFRFLKNFQISELHALLNAEGSELHDRIDTSIIVRVCGNDKIHFESGDYLHMALSVASSGSSWSSSTQANSSGYVREMFQTFQETAATDLATTLPSGETTVSVEQLLKNNVHKRRVRSACEKLCALLLSELRDAEQYVSHVESTRSVFRF